MSWSEVSIDLEKIKNKYGYESCYPYKELSLFNLYLKIEKQQEFITPIITKISNNNEFKKLINIAKQNNYSIQLLKKERYLYYLKLTKHEKFNKKSIISEVITWKEISFKIDRERKNLFLY